ncbi:MAG: hypothetical protein HOY79_26210 [Streptomyces sp.]|nr:hypothetical protein [Streptomyces sp.]
MQAVKGAAFRIPAWCLLNGSAAIEAAVSGIPVNPRLHLMVRLPRAGRRRRAAEDDLRAQLAAVSAAMPTAELALTVFEDYAVREMRFEAQLFPQYRSSPSGTALRATMYATAYFTAVAEAGEVLRELDTRAFGAWPDRPPHLRRAGLIRADEPGRPLRERPLPHRRRTLREIRRHTALEPPGLALSAIRAAHPTVLSWSAQVTYLTVPRWPLLRRLARQRRLQA